MPLESEAGASRHSALLDSPSCSRRSLNVAASVLRPLIGEESPSKGAGPVGTEVRHDYDAGAVSPAFDRPILNP